MLIMSLGLDLPSSLITHGALTIDLTRYRILLGGQPLALSYREYALLVYLATRVGRVVSRRQLLEEGLGRHDPGGLRTVDEHIRHLKSKLERGTELFLEAAGDGYRFVPQAHARPDQVSTSGVELRLHSRSVVTQI